MGLTVSLGHIGLLLPLGISFYTFQSMGYVLDVYREKVPAERNVGKLALFVSFFPQIIQGPIGCTTSWRTSSMPSTDTALTTSASAHS